MDLKDVMADRRHAADHLELGYARIPITAERPPDFADLSELIEVMIRSNATGAPVVINCQLGRGRSTLTSVRSRSPDASCDRHVDVRRRSFYCSFNNGSRGQGSIAPRPHQDRCSGL